MFGRKKRARELEAAKKRLVVYQEDKDKRAAELVIANKKLVYQNNQKIKKAKELAKANEELRKSEKHLKEHIAGLKEMMFMTSHKVRQPVTNIIGLTDMLEQSINDPDKLRKLIGYIKKSADDLNAFTKELSAHMEDMEQKEE